MPKIKTKKAAAKRLGKRKKGLKKRQVKGVSHLRTNKTVRNKKRTKKKRDIHKTNKKVLKKLVPGVKED